jgi:hypothetical protein
MGIKGSREADVIRGILDYLRLKGIPGWRSNNVPVYDPARKAFRRFRGARGLADVQAVLPPSGRLLCVEVKVTGRPTPEQEAFAAAVRKAGGVSLVVRSVGELVEELERLEGLKCS